VSTQCRYMQAAYPDLSAEDTCEGFHRHEDRVYNLARAIAAAVHECEPSDEQVAWFLNDADAVVDDFTPTPETWEVVNHGYPGGGARTQLRYAGQRGRVRRPRVRMGASHARQARDVGIVDPQGRGGGVVSTIWKFTTHVGYHWLGLP
jgi:hypothetical protein